LPFALVWIFPKDFGLKSQCMAKFAIKISIFREQKIYTLNNAISQLILSKNYLEAIDYIKELEKLNAEGTVHKYLAAYAYMNLGQYDEALKYAILSNNKKIEKKILNKMREKKNNGKLN
jgi:tetratricopeptide (TPR) repeat protein